ncbi:MAG: Asp-tRNA(Asn)/Glu-tRNA(Gln) amidotransferase subunit GatC [Candidatus Paceibacterota bacterium]|jgi:aspartyl/glutamyl-tRNA(Asn/Gln) amidotransferase C subunit
MDIKDIEKLAELSKIELSEEEKRGLLKDLDGILGYVKQISEVKVEDISVEYTRKNVWREDLPASGGLVIPREFSRELILKQFPESKDGFLKVKKIL